MDYLGGRIIKVGSDYHAYDPFMGFLGAFWLREQAELAIQMWEQEMLATSKILL